MNGTRMAAVALVLAVILTGCGGGSDDDSADPPATTTSLTVPPSKDLRGAVEVYSDSFLAGLGDRAFDLLSERCKVEVGHQQFVAAVAVAADRYDGIGISSYDEEVDGDVATVTYRYDDAPELDQVDERWIVEEGGWRNDDC